MIKRNDKYEYRGTRKPGKYGKCSDCGEDVKIYSIGRCRSCYSIHRYKLDTQQGVCNYLQGHKRAMENDDQRLTDTFIREMVMIDCGFGE